MAAHLELDQELPLLGTKISIPLLPPEFVHRPRLTRLIDRGVKRLLTLLSAPAGFGKTNLLVEWAAQGAALRGGQSSLPVAWLTLNREDNDLVRFYRYFTYALQAVVPRLGADTLDFIQSAKSSGLEVGLTLLLNEISALPNDLVLVLDEFQVLEDPDIIQSLNFLLKNLPPRLHFVIASRSEPPLDLAFLRAKGWVTELGANELRFTGQEVAQFFHQSLGLTLPPETVQDLAVRTEGWVTALQLAAISLHDQSNLLSMLTSFHGDAHYLVDFLTEEVLSQQPEDIRQFLLRCSILDVLTGPLCEAVVSPELPAGSGAAMLDRIEHANLFVTPLDQQHEWFRFHPLFADFLRHVLAEVEPGQAPALHQRAAGWFEQHGNLDEAFKHALASANQSWAADLIERNIEPLIKAGELQTLSHWIGSLPEPVVYDRPRLGLAYAWSLIGAYQLDSARFWLERVEQLLLDPPDEDGPPGSQAHTRRVWDLQGGLAICRSILALISGDVQQAAEFSRAAASQSLDDNPFIQGIATLEDGLYYTLAGDTAKAIKTLRESARIARRANNLMVLIVATCQMADMQAMQGHLTQALVTLQKARFAALGPDGQPLPLAGIIDNGFGEILRERDLLDEARTYLERGRQLTRPWWSLSSLDGLVTLARLLQSQGDLAGSQALITDAAHLALSTESSQWDDVFISTIAARLALQRGDLAAATQWWRRSGMQDARIQNYPFHVFEYLQLTQARFYLVTGQQSGDPGPLHQALALLQEILPEAERLQRVISKIEILVLRALAEAALGQVDQGAHTLLDALALGEPEDFRRIFLDEGQPLAALLVRCQAVRPAEPAYLPTQGYIESLLEAFGRAGIGSPAATPVPAASAWRDPASSEPGDDLSVSLSARELEVLTLIAAGKSNQEISAQLFLALNTVKRHAYNIYAKLNVKKRTQAVSKARQLGLIP